MHHNISQPMNSTYYIVQDIKNLISLLSKLNKTVNGVPHDIIIHRLYIGILYFQNVTHFHSTGMDIFFNNGHKKSMGLPTMMCMKLIHAQHAVQISYSKFHPNWTPGVETTGKTSFTTHISIKPTQ